MTPLEPHRVLITGAAGSVGGQLRAELQGVYPILRLSDRIDIDVLAGGEEFVKADVTDLVALERACAGVDGIVHLGGIPVERDWDDIQAVNIDGVHKLFEAARRQEVRRIVFASSHHVVGFYPRSRRIGTEAVPRPDTRYGVSKVFGEALGAFYADKFGLGVLSIRIGNVAPRPVDHRRLSNWISPADFAQLVRIGLEHPGLGYEVVYGVSDNTRGWWDNEAAFRLGYRPQSNAEDYAAAVLADQPVDPSDPIAKRYMGGEFAAVNYTGHTAPKADRQ